jgi:hypothetical protein
MDKTGHCDVKTLKEAAMLYEGVSAGMLTYIIGYAHMDETTRTKVCHILKHVVSPTKADYLSDHLGDDAIYGGQVRCLYGMATCACL